VSVAAKPAVFDRVLCGICGCPASTEAVRQAARLVAPDGALALVACADVAKAAAAGFLATQAAEEIHEEAAQAIELARALAPTSTAKLIHAPAVPTLLHEAELGGATLIAVGPGSSSRLGGIVLGRVATSLLHEAPCSVLVARRPADADAFPREIVVGIDGSAPSAFAAEAAVELAGRTGASIRGLVARGGKHVELENLPEAIPEVDFDDRAPVEALLAAARSADLLVLGSRGLHGFRALGSVSERVAHRARCSVLVARAP
jgi:nucleotide-binding universal stress UspA family protein